MLYKKIICNVCLWRESVLCPHFIPPPNREIVKFKDKTNDPLNELKDRIEEYIRYWKCQEQTKDICYMIHQLQHLERAIDGYQDYWRISLEEAENILAKNNMEK